MTISRPYRISVLLATLSFMAAAAAADAASPNPTWGGTASGGARHDPYIHRRSRNPIEALSDLFGIQVTTTSDNSNSLFRRSRDGEKSTTEGGDTPDDDDGGPVTYNPKCSIFNLEDDSTELLIEIPGVDPADVSIEVEDGSILRIRGTRQIRDDNSSSGWSTAEFDETFTMSTAEDADQLSATISRGILRIVVPRKEKRIRKIPIKTTATAVDEEEEEQKVEQKKTSEERRAVVVEDMDDNNSKTEKWDDDDEDREYMWE